MAEKRFLKIAAEEEARRAAMAELEPEVKRKGGAARSAQMRLMLVTGLALVAGAVVAFMTLTNDSDRSLGEQMQLAIGTELGLTPETRNPDLDTFAPAPEGWTRRDFASLRDARVAKGIVDMAITDIATSPESRPETTAAIVDRIRNDRLMDLTAVEKEKLTGGHWVGETVTLRDSGGRMATAVYTDGAEVFTIRLVRFGGIAGIEDAFHFNGVNWDKYGIEVLGRTYLDGTRSTDGKATDLLGVEDVVMLSQRINRNTYLYFSGIGSMETAEKLLAATDFALLESINIENEPVTPLETGE